MSKRAFIFFFIKLLWFSLLKLLQHLFMEHFLVFFKCVQCMFFLEGTTRCIFVNFLKILTNFKFFMCANAHVHQYVFLFYWSWCSSYNLTSFYLSVFQHQLLLLLCIFFWYEPLKVFHLMFLNNLGMSSLIIVLHGLQRNSVFFSLNLLLFFN